MLRTGREYLDGLRDGRVVYIGSERVADVTSHPGFRAAAETIAGIFDLKFDTRYRADLVVEEGEGAPYSAYFLAPQNSEDLAKRFRCHQRIADATYGLLGRSPDHVASLITGLAMEAAVLGGDDARPYTRHLLDYARDVRERDAYVAYAVLPQPSHAADGTAAHERGQSLRVIREESDGVVLRGVKGLATAAMFADEIWIGNLQPISESQEMEAITCVVRCNAPGLQIWSRRAFALSSTSEFDGPLSWRFDEGDAVLVFDDVKVDWSRVFVHREPARSSEIYVATPSHCLANHQSAVRSLSKVRLLVALARRVASATGAQAIPAVRDLLGRLAAFEATLAALVDAQVYRCDSWPSGGVSPNRRYVYAALNWCQESFSVLIDALRELSGAGAFRFPADDSVAESPELGPAFARFWGMQGGQARAQMHLFKLVWDLIGSEFAGRHQQYERFYAGPPFVVRGHSYREAPWSELDSVAAGLLDR